MRNVVCVAIAVCVLGFGAAQAQGPSMDAKGVIQKVRKGVLRVQTAKYDEDYASVEGGGGSGFIFEIDYDTGIAYAITNYHVAGHASFVSAQAWNRTVYNGEMVAAEPGIDIALIRLHGIPDERSLPDDQKTVTAIVLGDSDKVRIGEMGVTMGSPGAFELAVNRQDPLESFMLDQTANTNVITGRFTPIGWAISCWDGGHHDLNFQYGTNLDYAFRMSVAINHGNSGGPLINNRGEVVGINTWGLNHTGELPSESLGQDFNLAVPINQAKDFAYQVINTGKFQKPWLGLDLLFPATLLSPITQRRDQSVQDYEEFVERHRRAGQIEVYGVRKDSPGAKAGLQRGDVISDINGKKFQSPEEIRHWVFSQDIGTVLQLHILRGGKIMADPVKVTVGAKRGYDSEFSV